jgi:predicted ABC-type ATPase
MNPSQPIEAPRALVLAGPNGSGNVPELVIRRRFEQGWSNFQNICKALVDSWQVYDAMKTPPVLVDEGGHA